MKKITTIFLGILTALFIVNPGFTQSDFEGTITYDIDVTLPPDQAGMESMMPSEMIITIKDDKTRIEQMFGETGNKNIVISDYGKMQGFFAMNMMGQKMLINIDEQSFKEGIEQGKNNEVEKLDGKKEILGYSCDKAKLTNSGVDIITYYTDKLPNKMGQQLMSLPGMPLEYNIETQGMTMKFTAKNIDKSPVDDQAFEKPQGYQEMSMENFKKMGLGNLKF